MMAFKLTKKQIAERDALAADLRLKAALLVVAITEYNETSSTVAPAARDAIDAYNEAIEAARDFINGSLSPPVRYTTTNPRGGRTATRALRLIGGSVTGKISA
jgi:hypothetical protein